MAITLDELRMSHRDSPPCPVPWHLEAYRRFAEQYRTKLKGEQPSAEPELPSKESVARVVKACSDRYSGYVTVPKAWCGKEVQLTLETGNSHSLFRRVPISQGRIAAPREWIGNNVKAELGSGGNP